MFVQICSSRFKYAMTVATCLMSTLATTKTSWRAFASRIRAMSFSTASTVGNGGRGCRFFTGRLEKLSTIQTRPDFFSVYFLSFPSVNADHFPFFLPFFAPPALHGFPLVIRG
jgi:hypothetical protein